MASNLSNTASWSLYFNITEGCNNTCCFCASNSPLQAEQIIPTELVCNSLRRYPENSISQIVINGGEPTTHPGFKQILDCAIETGGRVILFTNGRMFAKNEKTAELGFHHLHRISIPIYGAIAEDHDRLVGKKGAWRQTRLGLQNLDRLRELDCGPVELELKLLAVSPSLPNWPNIVEFLGKLIKPPERVVLSGLILSETLLGYQQELRPSMKELDYPLNESIRRLRTLGVRLILLWSIPWCALDSDNLKYFLAQTINSEASEAQPAVRDIYFDYHFPEGIEIRPQEHEKVESDRGRCVQCQYLALCGGMPAFLKLTAQDEDVYHLPNI